MKFIFPQNYKMKTKILGLIDYQTAIITAIWSGLVFLLVNTLFSSLNIKIFIFIILVFPLIIFSVAGINGESILNVLIYMAKYIIKPKLFFYSK